MHNQVASSTPAAITPLTIKLAVEALASLEERVKTISTQWRRRIERTRYEAELASEGGQEALTKLRDMAKRETVTLVFAAHDSEHNNAVVLRDHRPESDP